MAWCRQATGHYLNQYLAKFVCHYLGANELIYSQTVIEMIFISQFAWYPT